MTCDVCGLPDNYRGRGDGIGSCDCPRCDCGAARGSYLCECLPDDGWCDCEEYDCAGECCGVGNCTCTPDRPIETVELPGISR